jgi:hypothetical protein
VQKPSVPVWFLALNQGDSGTAFDLRQDNEKSECSRFVNPRDVCLFTVIPVALRRLLGDRIKVSPTELRLARWTRPVPAFRQVADDTLAMSSLSVQ